VNKTNNKGMLVTVEFDINGNQYRIERGRSPNVLKFLVNEIDAVEETDEGQGEMRLTQQAIENMIGMNHVMFKHLVALNTYNEPFLALRANDQRDIIENLLGITMLSEKAVVLKELLKTTRDQIKEEEYRIKGVENANEQIKKSIADLQRRQRIWREKNDGEVKDLQQAVTDLEALDLEFELEQHVALEEYNRSAAALSECQRSIATLEANIQREQRSLDQAEAALKQAQEHRCYACGHTLKDEV
jgi:DNA repair exonuclease SbcCD ATPase subunit